MLARRRLPGRARRASNGRSDGVVLGGFAGKSCLDIASATGRFSFLLADRARRTSSALRSDPSKWPRRRRARSRTESLPDHPYSVSRTCIVGARGCDCLTRRHAAAARERGGQATAASGSRLRPTRCVGSEAKARRRRRDDDKPAAEPRRLISTTQWPPLSDSRRRRHPGTTEPTKPISDAFPHAEARDPPIARRGGAGQSLDSKRCTTARRGWGQAAVCAGCSRGPRWSLALSASVSSSAIDGSAVVGFGSTAAGGGERGSRLCCRLRQVAVFGCERVDDGDDR